MIIKKGTQDITVYFKLVDPASGVPETGLDVTLLDMTYTRNRAAAVKADVTALAAVDSAHGDNKMIQVDATNAPGFYRSDWPDAAFLTGADKVILCINGAAIDPAMMEIELVDNIEADTIAAIAALHDFDPVNDAVASVTLVDTCTTNTDMRGTDTAALASVCSETRLARLDATVSSRSSHAAADVWSVTARTLTTFGTLVTDAAAAVWAAVARTLTSGGDATSANQTTIINHLTGIKGATWNETTDALDANMNFLVAFATDAGVLLNAVTALVDAIKLQTDKLNFTGTDVKATLDSESVVVADKTGFSLSASGIDAIIDEVIESTYTLRQILRIILAAIAGKAAGGNTTEITYRDRADSKNRIQLTVDEDGNRTVSVLDGE